MADNALYTTDALTWLGLNLKTYSGDSPLASFLGTVCADPGIRPNDAPGNVKAYTTLGGMIMPYDPQGMDEFSAMIATALAVKRKSGNHAEIIFIMGHENCLFIGAMHKVLLGTEDKFPIRGRFINALLSEPLRKMLTKAVAAAAKRGDEERLVVRVLTELMLLESLRNFRNHIVDNDQNTVADYMDGKVRTAPRLNVFPALTLTTGEVIFFDPAASSFRKIKEIGAKKPGGKAEANQPIEAVLESARNNFVTRIKEGNYSDLIITRNSDAKTSSSSRQFPPRRTSVDGSS